MKAKELNTKLLENFAIKQLSELIPVKRNVLTKLLWTSYVQF